jgi:hypothetical protein
MLSAVETSRTTSSNRMSSPFFFTRLPTSIISFTVLSLR